jgi:uncharacterized protein
MQPPDELLLAVKQFNNQEWFECHETLEDLWMGERGMPRDFYQGILQISVAIYHWGNGNLNGAIKLLKSGVEILDKVDKVFMNMDVAGFLTDVNILRQELEKLGKDRMTGLNAALIPKLKPVTETDKNIRE